MRPRNNKKPPEVMTWGKATPALVISVIFDALRLMFEMFWFFGPALAAVICTVKAGGSSVAGGVCTLVAGAAGFFGAGAIETFGVVMAMATGLAGWLTVGLVLMIFNGRIFKENAIWFAGSLLVSETPIIGSVPALTITVWRMHSNQIRIEKEAYKKWEKENADAQAQERNRQNAQLMQARAAQQEAANDAMYEQSQATNEEILESVREAA